MKFRVLFLHKKQVVIFSLLLFFLLLFMLIYNLFSQKSYSETTSVMAIKDIEKGLKKDFNSDGKEDILYITTKEDKYYVSVNIKDKSYMLSPNKKIGSLGKEYNYWGMRIFIRDISRDGIPEIFLQSSQEGTPISHIFNWNGIDFNDIYFSTNNIIGILNSKNNKTPMFFSGSIVKGSLSFDSYMLIGTNLKNTSFENSVIPGKDEVITLIDNIENPYEPTVLPNIFTESISKNDTSLLWKLEKDIYSYSFQDGFFIDEKWDDQGNITSVMWELNFKKIDKSSGNSNDSVIIRASLRFSDNKYNISSLSFSS